jgi:hypothetical protein
VPFSLLRIACALQVSVSALRLRHAADAADALFGAASALRRPAAPPSSNGDTAGADSDGSSATPRTPSVPLRRRRRVLWDVNVALSDGIAAEWCTHDGGAAAAATASHGEVSFGSAAGGSTRGPAATPTAAASPFGSPFAAAPAAPPPPPLRITLHALRASLGGAPDALALSQLAIIRASGEWTVEVSDGALEAPSAALAPIGAAARRAARIHGAVWSAWRRGSRVGIPAAPSKPRGALHVRLHACTARTWADMPGTSSSSSSAGGASRCEALVSIAALRASMHPSRAAWHASLEDASVLYRDPGRKDATPTAAAAASTPAASASASAPPPPPEVLVFESHCLYLAAEPAAPFGRPPALHAPRALRIGGEGVAVRWDPDAHFLAQRVASEMVASHRAAAAAAASSSPVDAFGRPMPALGAQGTAQGGDDASAAKTAKAARGAPSLSLDVAHFRAELLASSCLRASLSCERVCGDSAPETLARGIDLAALSLGVNGATVMSATQFSVRPPPPRAPAVADAAASAPTPPVWITPLQLTPEPGGDAAAPPSSAATLTASTPVPRLARTATAGRSLRRTASLERGRDGAAARAGCLLPAPRERATWHIDATSAALRMPHGLDLGASVAAFETFAKAFRAVGGAPFLPRRDGAGGGAPAAPAAPATPGGSGGAASDAPPPLTELFLRLRGGVTLSAEDAPLERWLHARRRAAAAGAAAAAAAAAVADGADAAAGIDGGAAAAAAAAFRDAFPGAESAAYSSVFCLAGTEADLLLVFGGGAAATAAAAALAAAVDAPGCDGVPLRVARAACLDLCIAQPRLRFRDHAAPVLAADSLCISGPLVMARQAVPPPAAAAAAVPQRVGRRRAAHRAAPPPADAPTAPLKLWSDLRLNASALTVRYAACGLLCAHMQALA